MTVFTTLGNITAAPDTLNQISFYLMDCSGAAKTASDEIYLSLKLSGFYDKKED